MKALVINETRSHYGFVIDVEQNRDGSYYDSVTDLVYEARELQFQWQENPVDWSSFRREAVKNILCAILKSDCGHSSLEGHEFITGSVQGAIIFADELIKQLKDEPKKGL